MVQKEAQWIYKDVLQEFNSLHSANRGRPKVGSMCKKVRRDRGNIMVIIWSEQTTPVTFAFVAWQEHKYGQSILGGVIMKEHSSVGAMCDIRTNESCLTEHIVQGCMWPCALFIDCCKKSTVAHEFTAFSLQLIDHIHTGLLFCSPHQVTNGCNVCLAPEFIRFFPISSLPPTLSFTCESLINLDTLTIPGKFAHALHCCLQPSRCQILSVRAL